MLVKKSCLVQVFLGRNGVRDIEGNELPRLVYVSREKRPGFDHHKKAGAMNALVRRTLMFIIGSLLHEDMLVIYLSSFCRYGCQPSYQMLLIF